MKYFLIVGKFLKKYILFILFVLIYGQFMYIHGAKDGYDEAADFTIRQLELMNEALECAGKGVDL